jgi:uncharacterized protein (DUF952 family)
VPIYHIATNSDWDQRSDSEYRPARLDEEGFVHCSDASQVVKTANTRFAGRDDLVLLTLDESQLGSTVVWEDSYASGTEFPHVYGPIPRRAITDVASFAPDSDGRFDWWNAAV